VAVVAVLALTDGFRWARELDRKRIGLLALAAGLITLNWGAFISAAILATWSRRRSATSSTRS